MAQLSRTLMIVAALVALGCNTSSTPTAPANVEITPDSVAVGADRSAQLTVIDGAGNSITDGVVWRSSNPIVASVDDSGMVTGGYGPGSATISADVRGAVATAEASVVSPCAAPLVPQGTPDPDLEVQRFDVRFEPGTDVPSRARDLSRSYGFTLESVSSDGFIAALSPVQASGVGCSGDVESLTYL